MAAGVDNYQMTVFVLQRNSFQAL